MSMTVCDVVIPCRDEAAALPIVLASVPHDWRVIVVDNGSTDGTADVARSLGAHVVSESRPGYGAAVHAGMLAADAEYVAVIDGDASMRLLDLVPMLDLVRDGAATMAIGRRRPVARGVWPWHARAGTKLLAGLIRRRSDFPIHDLAPMRVCRRDDLLALGVEDRRFGYPLELMLQGRRSRMDRCRDRRGVRRAALPAPSRRSPARSPAPRGSSATSPECCDDQPHPAHRRQGAQSPDSPRPASPRRSATTPPQSLPPLHLLDTLDAAAAVGWPLVVAMTGDLARGRPSRRDHRGAA